MRFHTFIIGFMLCGKVSFSQLSVSSIDSLNARMLNQQFPIDLTKLGIARIELKDGTVLLKCEIFEVKSMYIVYKKRAVLHDQVIDKIKNIRFEDRRLKLEFDEKNRGKLTIVYPE